MDVKDKMEAKLIHNSPRMMKEGGRGGQPAAAGLFVFFNQIKCRECYKNVCVFNSGIV
jgi:hypothetical protein